jgi:IS5 family transposase
MEAAVAPKLAHQANPAKRLAGVDLVGTFDGEFGGGISPAGLLRLPIRLVASLLYLKHSFNLSDEELLERWAENVQWQFFSGMDRYGPRLPCDATPISCCGRSLVSAWAGFFASCRPCSRLRWASCSRCTADPGNWDRVAGPLAAQVLVVPAK